VTPAPIVLTPFDPCAPPLGWVAYTIRAGDNVFRLAQATGTTVADVRAANCLADADVIFAGQILYLPGVPGAQATPAPSLSVIGCAARGVSIAAPTVAQTVRDVFEVRGTADIPNFSYYRLEVRAANAETYTEVTRSAVPVVDGVLGRVDARLFGSGFFYIRLVAVDARGGFPQPCAIPVLFG
jgi:LysM repeat protein